MLIREEDVQGGISIHSPHARGDNSCHLGHAVFQNFNPLPSCEGRREDRRDETRRDHFNPLPSCEGRREVWQAVRLHR